MLDKTHHITQSIVDSVRNSKEFSDPYRHFLFENFFPHDVAKELNDLPLPAPDLHGLSGKRELHNDTRSYFDQASMQKYPVMEMIAEALQTPKTIALFEDHFGTSLDHTYLRLEYAQDIDGFWLEPHTDLGVKKFTCLIYLSDEAGQEDLGTDIFRSKEEHFGRSPFRQNAGLIFVPDNDTWHGFVKRPISGIRKSVILNYVTDEWRAKEQLSFPKTSVKRS